MLEFNIRNQEISRIDNFSPAEKSVEYLIAKFNFKTEDWNEAIKRAIFRNVKSKVEKDAMLEDDACIVPWEVLVGSGEIEVSVHGVGKETITTDVATFNLDRTLSGGSATQEPSPTVYAQMVEMVKETKEVAQSVRNDADNGKFSGIPGEKGDDGKSAYQYAVEGGFKGTEAEFTDLMGTAGGVDLTGYVSKEQHEAELLKTMVKVTTDKSPFHHITDSANMKVLDFGMEGITEQYTGTITDDEGNEVTVPNPNNPQEIKLAGVLNEETGRYEHKCCVGNKNWSTFKHYDSFNSPSGMLYQSCYIPYPIRVSITDDFPSDLDIGWYIAFKYKDGTMAYGYIKSSNNNINLPKTFTASEENPIVQIRYVTGDKRYPSGTGTGFQIEIGTKTTDYTPHASQPFTLTSDRPLTKWDKLVKRDGVWGWSVWSEMYENYVISAKDSISCAPSGTHDRFYINNFKSFMGANGKCNIYRWESKILSSGNYYCGFIHNGSLVIYLPKGDVGWVDGSSVTGNNNKVIEYMADKPLTICYETAEEQSFIPLPDEEQTLLNNLETYYGVTNVYNEQGCPMWFKYCADQELHWNQKLLQIQQAII